MPGLVAALEWWKRTYGADAKPDEPFFTQPSGERIRVDGLAARYRAMLEATLRRCDRTAPSCSSAANGGSS